MQTTSAGISTEILTQAQSTQLEEQGYTVVPGFLDRGLAARLRAHLDSLCPPIGSSPGKVYDHRHPFPGEIIAEALYDTRLLPLAASLIESPDLVLLEQVLVRSDPAAPGTKAGASGWHVDVPFWRSEYNARPRRTYFHCIHALSAVQPGGGAFTIIPGSHHRTYAAADKLPTYEQLVTLLKDQLGLSGLDTTQAIEVCPNEGDLLIFNPMAIHSASPNVRDTPRYVYFTSFFHPSATHLRSHLTKMNYWRKFPEALHRRLPAAYPHLLETEPK